MKKQKHSLLGLERVLPMLSQQRGWEEQLDLHSVFVNWSKLLDKDISDHCQPLKIISKVLWIEVENSAWLQQFQFQTVLILDVLNQSLRISKLKGIRFCVESEERRATEQQKPALVYSQPSAEEITEFEQQIECIPDKNVRDAMIRFWYISHACKKGMAEK